MQFTSRSTARHTSSISSLIETQEKSNAAYSAHSPRRRSGSRKPLPRCKKRALTFFVKARAAGACWHSQLLPSPMPLCKKFGRHGAQRATTGTGTGGELAQREPELMGSPMESDIFVTVSTSPSLKTPRWVLLADKAVRSRRARNAWHRTCSGNNQRHSSYPDDTFRGNSKRG